MTQTNNKYEIKLILKFKLIYFIASLFLSPPTKPATIMAQFVDDNFVILFDTAWSPDNQWLLACSTYVHVFIWHIQTF